MDITHWIDYTILFFLAFSAVCVSVIHIRKTLKYGYLKALLKPIDNSDKKLLKTSGTLFIIFIVLLVIRFSFLDEKNLNKLNDEFNIFIKPFKTHIQH
ncbi:MAG: hypothetical protein MUP22_12040 [Desulfobacterales bacterium]|nr:hypothetical protein [Desulfobacterales bacterium]